jgi:hypothetical protein
MTTDQAEMERTLTVNLALTADLDEKGKVVISGDRSTKELGKGDPPCPFNFTLTDNTNLNVKFLSLDTEDDWSQCPPPGGENSKQIVGIHIHNDKTPKTAKFTDNNGNKGAMDVCYQWNFTCDDPSKLPITFDPIIKNGGTN